MKKIALLLAIVFSFIFLTAFFPSKTDFDKKWKEVEKLQNKGLPESALKIVEEIYNEAKNIKDHPNEIKALIYKASLNSTFKENYLKESIEEFEKEIPEASFPVKQILYSLTAELYHSYYTNNRWKILEIKPSDINDSDIASWDAVKLNKQISDYYLLSVKPAKELANISLNDYYIIMKNLNEDSYKYRKTLYDLLSERAIKYFSSNDYDISKVKTVTKNTKELFLPINKFIKLNINDNSADNTVLKLYQTLLKAHFNDKDPSAIIDIDLQRLKFEFSISKQTDKDRKLYLKTIETLFKDYKNLNTSVLPALELVKQYENLGNRYSAVDSSTFKYRFYNIKAHDLAKQILLKFPKSKFAGNFKNILNRLEKKDFYLTVEKFIVPKTPSLGLLSFKNITTLYLNIIKIDNPDTVFLNRKTNKDRIALSNEFLNAEPVVKEKISLPDTKDLQYHSTEIKIKPLQYGIYFVYLSDSPDLKNTEIIKSSIITVTDLTLLTSSNKNREKFFVVDRNDGKPLKKVKGEIYKYHYSGHNRGFYKEFEFITGKNGFAQTGEDFKSASAVIKLIRGNDLLYSQEYISKIGKRNTKSVTKAYLFTDRSVYRPGQTVYFKGIVIERTGKNIKILKNHETEVVFRNANYKKVSSLKVKTNDFGSFSGAFVIPRGSINGNMRLQTSYGNISFLVEEYKRPSFSVIFDTLSGAFKFGDSISFKGKVTYYNGFPVANAQVTYRITRSVFYPIPLRYYIPFPRIPDMDIKTGTTIVDSNGEFVITFKTDTEKNNTSYRFNCYADVTDITGEVQTGKTDVTISNKPFWLKFYTPDDFNTKTDSIKIVAVNSAGKEVYIKGKLAVYKISGNKKTFIKRYWQKPDLWTMSSDEYRNFFPNYAYKNEDNPENREASLIYNDSIFITGNILVDKSFLKGLKAGYYKFVIEAEGEKDTKYILVYNPENKIAVNSDILWYKLSKSSVEPGKKVDIFISAAQKNTRIIYQLIKDSEIIDEKLLQLSGKQTVISVPVDETFRGGFAINLLTVKFNRLFNFNEAVSVPYTNKKLNIKLETLRNHLTPGKNETWKVTIKDFNNNGVVAELLANMYDASLDAIKPHNWDFSLYNQRINVISWKSGSFGLEHLNPLKIFEQNYFTEYQIKYPDFKWFGMRLGNSWGFYRYSNNEPKMVAAMDMGLPKQNIETKTEKTKPVNNIKQQKKTIETVMRSDFNETAFFFPQLQTDSTGTALFTFTTPDALTEWKLMLLAHSTDLKTGLQTYNFKAFKEIMIMPNTPRFVRQNDKIIFSARVINNSTKNQNINVNITFFNPVTDKPLNLFLKKISSDKNISLLPGESKKVSWFIKIPENIDLLAYKIKAESSTFSDGEIKLIPVLSNRILVTETLPMLIKPNKKKNFVFTDFRKKQVQSGLRNFNFTVEFTSNPAWYAIQALPYLNEPVTENPLSLFNTYFANILSGWIINSTPKIKSVFDSWKMTSPKEFLSQLQKNNELKNVILEETPWVLEAENENAQKQRIALLFDINNLKNNQQITIDKLQKLQLPSGAWPWFNGMNEDRYTTQKIVSGLANLLDKGIIDNESTEIKLMLTGAVNYIDKTIEKDYKKLKETKGVDLNNYHITPFQIQYLYARSLLLKKYPVKTETLEAYNYYLGQASQYKLKFSNYLQALTVIILTENNKKEDALALLKSLKERSLKDKDGAMYWRKENSWQWFKAPIETETAILSAFERTGYSPEDIEAMKLWLLKQKKMQHWATTNATAEAVYALLISGSNNLLAENKPVKVKVGGEKIDFKEKDIKPVSGSGYFKVSWENSDITPELGNIEVENPNNHISWGAAYWQYFEDINKVTSAGKGLTIKKYLLKETTDGNKTVLKAQDNLKFNIGDKIYIRLVINNDKDMEFVSLKDSRATGMETVNHLSGYEYKQGLGYYKNNKDAATMFYFRYLPKGTFVLEYPVFLTQKGVFPVGIASIQSMYAPEFSAHSDGFKIVVE